MTPVESNKSSRSESFENVQHKSSSMTKLKMGIKGTWKGKDMVEGWRTLGWENVKEEEFAYLPAKCFRYLSECDVIQMPDRLFVNLKESQLEQMQKKVYLTAIPKLKDGFVESHFEKMSDDELKASYDAMGDQAKIRVLGKWECSQLHHHEGDFPEDVLVSVNTTAGYVLRMVLLKLAESWKNMDKRVGVFRAMSQERRREFHRLFTDKEIAIVIESLPVREGANLFDLMEWLNRDGVKDEITREVMTKILMVEKMADYEKGSFGNLKGKLRKSLSKELNRREKVKKEVETKGVKREAQSDKK